MNITRAPWTERQVERLLEWQMGIQHPLAPKVSSMFMPHPFTCGNRGAEGHQWRWDDRGTLVPTRNGFVCPDCDYRQGWAHQFMTDPDLAAWPEDGVPHV